jgi:hypothetical protein
MVSIIYAGRLGNNFFQYAAAYIFAKKFNLTIITPPIYNIFNLPIIQGNIYDNQVIDINDDNYLSLLKSDKIENAHYRFVGFYQIKEFILEYHNEIKSIFNLKYNDVDKNLVFITYRIGDILNTKNMLPIEYYINALHSLNCSGGFISSDTLNHPNVLMLANDFNLKLYDNSPNETINFAKNFNNLILSEGTFSWWIGFLSNAKNIIYNERPRFWHGDIFVLPEWKVINISN